MGGAGSRGGTKVARVPIRGRRRAGTEVTHWAGHWLCGSQLKSAIGCVGLSRGGYWVRGAGKMSSAARIPSPTLDLAAPELRSTRGHVPPEVPQGIHSTLPNCPEGLQVLPICLLEREGLFRIPLTPFCASAPFQQTGQPRPAASL